MFPVLVKYANLPQPAWDPDVQTYPKEEFNDGLLRDAPAVTLPPSPVFDYINHNPTLFDMVPFRRIQTAGKELQI